MSGIAESCVQQVLGIASCSDLFGGDGRTTGNKAFRIYDPGILQQIASELNYPVCGVIYGGIHSQNLRYDQGISSYLHVGVMVLAESKARDYTQNVDHDEISVLLDLLRNRVLNDENGARLSPQGNEWEFFGEAPNDLKDRGFVYFQQFRTAVTV